MRHEHALDTTAKPGYMGAVSEFVSDEVNESPDLPGRFWTACILNRLRIMCLT